MRTLVHLDQHDLDLHSLADTDISYTRQAARCVLLNDQNEVALIYFSRDEFYKLPGGGLDEDEDIESGLKREVKEETGCDITTITPLGIIEEDRYYCGMHQTSYCYMARVQAEGQNDPTAEEIEAGVELRWANSLETAMDLIGDSEAIADEEGEPIGFEMMRLRELHILKAAEEVALA